MITVLAEEMNQLTRVSIIPYDPLALENWPRSRTVFLRLEIFRTGLPLATMRIFPVR